MAPLAASLRGRRSNDPIDQGYFEFFEFLLKFLKLQIANLKILLVFENNGLVMNKDNSIFFLLPASFFFFLLIDRGSRLIVMDDPIMLFHGFLLVFISKY